MAFAILASAMTISSYFAYTTAGLDVEFPTGRGMAVRYYRLRWDDGSTWAGLAVQPISYDRWSPPWFDPGGTILDAPTRPEPRTWANVLGFWQVDGPTTDPYVAARYPGATESRWWAVPSWLVLLLIWHRLARRLVWSRPRSRCARLDAGITR